MNIGVIRKTVYDKLIIKLNAIDTKIESTSGLVTESQYDSDKQGLEKKIEDNTKKIPVAGENKIVDITNLTTKVALNAKGKEVESKIPDITNLAIKVALNTKATVIENKIPDTTGFITTPEFNRLTKISFDARMKEAAKTLASKSQIDNSFDISDENEKRNFRHFI